MIETKKNNMSNRVLQSTEIILIIVAVVFVTAGFLTLSLAFHGVINGVNENRIYHDNEIISEGELYE